MKNKILVVEDDLAISELICMNLEAAGYDTLAVFDGEAIERLLQKKKPPTLRWWISCFQEKMDFL